LHSEVPHYVYTLWNSLRQDKSLKLSAASSPDRR
jgi:hypothetical protein